MDRVNFASRRLGNIVLGAMTLNAKRLNVVNLIASAL